MASAETNRNVSYSFMVQFGNVISAINEGLPPLNLKTDASIGSI